MAGPALGQTMSSTNPDKNLTTTEFARLKALEAITQQGLSTYAEVAEALAEIREDRLYRDVHATFPDYLRERWRLGTEPATVAPRRREPARSAGGSCEALAKVWEQALEALEDDEVSAADIRLTVRKRPGEPDTTMPASPGGPTLERETLLGQWRWLLAQASGTIADVAHQLETRGAVVDEAVLDQLRRDVDVLDEELDMVRALLVINVDWDAEYRRLLSGELPPFDDDDRYDD